MHVSSRFPQSPPVEPRKYFVKHIWDFERRVVRVKAKRLKEPCRPYCSVHQWTEKTTESWEMYRKATLMARGGPIEVDTAYIANPLNIWAYRTQNFWNFEIFVTYIVGQKITKLSIFKEETFILRILWVKSDFIPILRTKTRNIFLLIICAYSQGKNPPPLLMATATTAGFWKNRLDSGKKLISKPRISNPWIGNSYKII